MIFLKLSFQKEKWQVDKETAVLRSINQAENKHTWIAALQNNLFCYGVRSRKII